MAPSGFWRHYSFTLADSNGFAELIIFPISGTGEGGQMVTVFAGILHKGFQSSDGICREIKEGGGGVGDTNRDERW